MNNKLSIIPFQHSHRTLPPERKFRFANENTWFVAPIENISKGAIVHWKGPRLHKYKSRTLWQLVTQSKTNPRQSLQQERKRVPHCLPSEVLRQLHPCEPRTMWSLIIETHKKSMPIHLKKKHRLRHWPSVESFTPASHMRAKNTLVTGHGKKKKMHPNPHRQKKQHLPGAA